ncbi:N-acetylmuramic acid 6-phosphate etherase [Rugosimonospora acidiphila]|uniref:N-acetylmuramic acid 6-phosphate etherase n=1 Tax=Rugosimonospora acidiphila TaxID=556531 RepID=A0ABP9SDU2_9ACTN
MSASADHAAWVVAPTEERNPHTLDIDLRTTIDILHMINDEDARVPRAVRDALPALAAAVELGVAALRGGHRVHYFGAGTSGRMAVLDAAELIPTYDLEPSWVVAHHAGGAQAMKQPIEDVEDDEAGGAAEAAGLGPGDVAIGLTASGRTPYVTGALRAARARGAGTVLISANPGAALGTEVDVHVGVSTGPEVIAGSTRMKAGTAQKLLLNAFSTALMVRMERTYSNLMVAVAARNAKLRGRVVRILVEATGLDPQTCALAARQAGGDCRVALVSLLAGVPAGTARQALAASSGGVRRALTVAQAAGTEIEVTVSSAERAQT